MKSAEKILKPFIQEYSKTNITALALGSIRLDFLNEIENQYQLKLYKNMSNEVDEESHDQNRIYHIPFDEIDTINKRFPIVFAKQVMRNVQCFQFFLNHLDLILAFDGVFILVDRFDSIYDETSLELGLEFFINHFSKSEYEIIKYGIQGPFFYLIVKKMYFRLAVAVDEENYILQDLFGNSVRFDIYEIRNNKLEKIGSRLNIYTPEFDHQNTHKIYDLVNDCSVFIGSAFCENAKELLIERGIHLIEEQNSMNMNELILNKEQLYFRV